MIDKETQKKLKQIKKKISQLKKEIKKLGNRRQERFSLPGKNLSSSFLHQARAITRRLERRVVSLARKKDQPLIAYLNQLSLLLFWLALKEEKIK